MAQVPTISNLNIAPTANGLNNVGLFASNAGTISNLHLSNVTVTANPNAGVGLDNPSQSSQFIGTLAGQNSGTISNVIVDGSSTVTAAQGLTGVIAGGLVGQNGILGQDGQSARITHSQAEVTVTLGGGAPCMGGSCNGGWN